MAEDLKFELSILATVQGFYQKLLRDSLGGDVPIPSGTELERAILPNVEKIVAAARRALEFRA